MSGAWQFPWDTEPPPRVLGTAPDPAASKLKPRGRRPAAAIPASTSAPGAPAGWLYHHLTIHGPAGAVEAFAAAARGAGITPWQLDFADIEEAVFVRAVAQPAGRRHLTVEGCRILARQFRERVEARQARAAALVGQSRACPFDLHVLLPVPTPILMLGPTHPTALAWLTTHWGVTDRLRQVVVRDKATAGRRMPRDHGVRGYGFFIARETPQVAINQLATRWPALRFALVPRPAD